MRHAPTVWLCVACVVAFLAIGIPYWPIPYGQVSLPSSIQTYQLVIVAVAACLVRVAGGVKTTTAVFAVAAAVPGAILARVIVEVARDPTSHNLWPFELLIGLVLGLLAAAAGALAGALLLRFAGR